MTQIAKTIAALFLFAGALSAQTLHLVIVPEASDRNIREATQVDGINIDAVFSGNVSQRNIRVYNLDGQKITGDTIQSQLQRVQAGANDTIVFYFSGHGAYNDRVGHYLQLADNQYILRQQLTDMLKSKGARLCVLLTETCFGFDPDQPGQMAPAMVENFRNSPLFLRLFFQTKGFVDINSCKQGQLAYTYPNTADGSIFTKAFSTTLQQMRNRNDLDWNGLLSLVEQRTTSEFKRHYPRGKVSRTENGRVTQRSQTPSFVTPLAVSTVSVRARPEPLVNRPRPEVNRRPGPPAPPVPQSNPTPRGNIRHPLVKTVRLPLGITMGACEDPGVHIKSVAPNSPATRCVTANGATGSLSPNDHILGINGVPVSTPQQVQQLVANANVLTMRVRIRATGEVLDVQTRLVEERTIETRRPVANNPNRPDRLGLVCRTCRDGVHVDQVVPGSPASRIKMGQEYVSINPGVHVISVHGKAVNNLQQYQQALSAAPQETWIQIKDAQGIVTPLTITLAY